MNTENTTTIKGSCMTCGFAYKGTVILSNEGIFPEILCPKCGKETNNFSYEDEIDYLEKVENYHLDYKQSEFTYVKTT